MALPLEGIKVIDFTGVQAGPACTHATDPQSLTRALAAALGSGKPALINCVIDPTAGSESGHLQNLNPQSQVENRNGA